MKFLSQSKGKKNNSETLKDAPHSLMEAFPKQLDKVIVLLCQARSNPFTSLLCLLLEIFFLPQSFSSFPRAFSFSNFIFLLSPSLHEKSVPPPSLVLGSSPLSNVPQDRTFLSMGYFPTSFNHHSSLSTTSPCQLPLYPCFRSRTSWEGPRRVNPVVIITSVSLGAAP